MILIDLEKAEQKVALTLGGFSILYALELKHDSSRKEFKLDIVVDSFNSRYDLFKIPSETFADMPEGYYSYAIKGVYRSTGFNVVFTEEFGSRKETFVMERGKLYIKPTEQPQPVSVTNSTNEILVFTK